MPPASLADACRPRNRSPPQDAALGAARAAQSFLPSDGVEVPLRAGETQIGGSSWLMTTYLDDTLRISRGDGGGVFVLVKERYW